MLPGHCHIAGIAFHIGCSINHCRGHFGQRSPRSELPNGQPATGSELQQMWTSPVASTLAKKEVGGVEHLANTAEDRWRQLRREVRSEVDEQS